MTKEIDGKLAQAGNDQICPAAFVVRDGLILIGLRHYGPDKFKTIDLWTSPGGRCQPGEPIEQALRRETAEEIGVTGLDICEYLGDVPGAKSGDIVPVFVCRLPADQEPKLMEPDKFSEWRWVEPHQVPDNFINPAALHLVRAWLSGQAG